MTQLMQCDVCKQTTGGGKGALKNKDFFRITITSYDRDKPPWNRKAADICKDCCAIIMASLSGKE